MRARMMATLLVAGFLVLPGVQAQTVYKCVNNGQPTSFQSEPCSAGQRQVAAVAYTPDTVGPYRPDVQSRPYATTPSKRLGRRSAITLRQPKPTACELARRQRDAVLGRNNQSGGYEVRVKLNDAVQQACS